MKHFNSIANLLEHCSETKNLKWIQKLHAHLITTGLFFLTPNLQTKLIYSYTSCLQQNSITTLTHLFKSLNPNNPLPFNSIISHFSQNGLHAFALQTFSCMHFGSVYIDSYALCCSITSSTYVNNVGYDAPLDVDEMVSSNSLSSLNDNTLLKYCGSWCRFRVRSSPLPYSSIYHPPSRRANERGGGVSSSLHYRNNVGCGEIMHAYVIRSGWLRSVFVGCSLIDMYAKSLCVDDAALLFDEIPERNSVCANALLSGYVEARKWREGLELVRNMPRLNLDCDNLTLSGALRACAGLSAVELGRQVHAFVIRHVLDVMCDVYLQSLLIEMYGKCGLVKKGRKVFDKLGFEQGGESKKDVVLWTSMLGAYGRNGDFEEVINLFRVMLIEGTRPDGISFLTVISACGHCGQVELGMEYFESMSRDFGLAHDPEHYCCVIDLLCRAGELAKAWKLVHEMPNVENNHTVSLWGSLLSACLECGNVELGKLAAQKALELEPQNMGIYLLLSNIYAKNGMWDDIEQLRGGMNERGLKKDIGRSWVDLCT